MSAPVEPVSNLAFGISMLPFLLLLVFGLRAQRRVGAILRQNHPTVWQELDQPSGILDNNAAANIRFIKYIVGRKWRNLADPELDRAVRKLVMLYAAYLAYIPLLFAGFLIYVWYLRP